MGKGYYSPGYKDLVTKMLQYDPANRLTLDQIANHSWLKEETPQAQDILDQFQ